jgi:hypothetical protein
MTLRFRLPTLILDLFRPAIPAVLAEQVLGYGARTFVPSMFSNAPHPLPARQYAGFAVRSSQLTRQSGIDAHGFLKETVPQPCQLSE